MGCCSSHQTKTTFHAQEPFLPEPVASDPFQIDDTKNDVMRKQHDELIKLIRALDADKSNKDLLDKVLGHTVKHFENEEALMKDLGAPKKEVEKKIEMHSKLMKDAVDATTGKPVTDDTIKFLKKWLAEHILSSDQTMIQASHRIDIPEPFEFSDRFDVKNDVVNKQHKELFDLIRALGADKGNKDLLKEVLGHTVKHFQDEEAIMEELGTPVVELEEHRKIHAKLMKEAVRATTGKPVTEDTINFLKKWLVEHILAVDRNAMSTDSRRPKALWILVGSQCGTGEALVNSSLTVAASAAGLAPKVVTLNEGVELLTSECKPTEKPCCVVVVTSTWGVGNYPDNGLEWKDAADAGRFADAFKNFKWALFGLGNSYRRTFCAAARHAEAQITAGGGEFVIPPVFSCEMEYADTDEGHVPCFEEFQKNLLLSLQ